MQPFDQFQSSDQMEEHDRGSYRPDPSGSLPPREEADAVSQSASAHEISESFPVQDTRPMFTPEDVRQARTEIQRGKVYPPPALFYEETLYQLEPLKLPIIAPGAPIGEPVEIDWQRNEGFDRSKMSDAAVQSWGQPVAPSIPKSASDKGWNPSSGYYNSVYPTYSQPGASHKTNRWAWGVVITVGLITLLSCSLITWAFSTYIGSTTQELSGGVNTVQDFYDALRVRNHDVAYQYLALEESRRVLSKADFIKQVQSQEVQNGTIISATPSQPSFVPKENGAPDLANFSMNVDVVRSKKSYSIIIHVKKVNGVWRIVDYTQL